MGDAAPLGQITEQQFDSTFGLNARGTLFTVQKALPLLSRWRLDLHDRIGRLGSKAFPAYSVYAASKAALRRSPARGSTN